MSTFNVEKGEIFKCDLILKEFIKHLQEKGTVNQGIDFILHDLGEAGLFIKSGVSDQLFEHVNALMDSNAKPDVKEK